MGQACPPRVGSAPLRSLRGSAVAEAGGPLRVRPRGWVWPGARGHSSGWEGRPWSGGMATPSAGECDYAIAQLPPMNPGPSMGSRTEWSTEAGDSAQRADDLTQRS